LLSRHGASLASKPESFGFGRTFTDMTACPLTGHADLPATFIKLCDDQGGKLEIVGEEAEALVGFLVVENDIAQILRIVVGRVYAGEANGLIATQTRRFIDRARINAIETSVAFWAYDEESACLRQPIQPREIEEPAIHDGEAAGLRRHQVEYVHFVHFTVRNVDK